MVVVAQTIVQPYLECVTSCRYFRYKQVRVHIAFPSASQGLGLDCDCATGAAPVACTKQAFGATRTIAELGYVWVTSMEVCSCSCDGSGHLVGCIWEMFGESHGGRPVLLDWWLQQHLE